MLTRRHPEDGNLSPLGGQTTVIKDTRGDALFLWWLLATVVGFTGGAAIAALILKELEQVVLGAAIAGVTAQWLVLRGQIANAYYWILATTMGAVVGVVLGSGALLLCVMLGLGVSWQSPGIPIPGAMSFAIAAAVVGASVGLAQWLVLKRHVVRVGGWITASTMSWLMGCTLVGPLIVASHVFRGLGEAEVAVGFIAGLSSSMGLITGYLLDSALHQPS